MSTRELLAIVKARGLRVELVNGRPHLVPAPGKRPEATDRLLAVLKIHRERIIEMLQEGKANG